MIIAITQARMSSTRCPGKVLEPILDHPMIWHQQERTKRSQYLNHSIIATSTEESDNVLADYFLKANEPVFRGSLNNVLSRYYECALEYGATHIVRLTADCPLIDPLIIDKAITYHLEHGRDYTYIHHYPVGLSVEVCTFSALQKAYYQANLRSQREHVTLFIYQNPELFKIGRISHKEDLSTLRWTVDYPEDLEFVTQVYQALYPSNINFNFQDVLALLKSQPELAAINSHIKPNEGLQKSLDEDKEMSYLDEE